MFPTWRLKVREAQIALNAGQPDEAGRILQQESVREFLPAKRLSEKVARQLVSRAEQAFQRGDSLASWTDLQQASRLGGCDAEIAELRLAQAQRGIDRVRSLLLQGETSMATHQINRLEQRQLGGEQRRAWKLIVHLISRAKELAEQGKAVEAVEMLQRASHLIPGEDAEIARMLESRISNLTDQTTRLRELSTQLHAALSQQAWTEVLSTADAMLELAPAHSAARQARYRAWDAVGMKATQVRTPKHAASRLARCLKSTRAWVNSAKVDTKAMSTERSKRMVAWIDGVGGYMLCLGEELVLGQPAGAASADIAVLADLSRRHAIIRRERESYVISPIHEVRIGGNLLTGPQVLKDGALIELGEAVKMRFRKPHALSNSAVLTLESHHKTQPAVDGIVLMSESCVLGAQAQSHIVCRDWPSELVLFRRGEDLQFRTNEQVELDGEPQARGGVVADATRIVGERFALSFEEV